MAPRIPDKRRPRSPNPSPSLLGMNHQQAHLNRVYPNPEQHPFQVRLPARPDHADPERDQVLYKMPHYRYPHTLTFLDNFTPDAEAEMIRQFENAQGNPGRVPLPLASSFHDGTSFRVDDRNDEAGGWGEMGRDLVTMGIGWAAELIGLTNRTDAPAVLRLPNHREVAAPGQAVNRRGVPKQTPLARLGEVTRPAQVPPHDSRQVERRPASGLITPNTSGLQPHAPVSKNAFRAPELFDSDTESDPEGEVLAQRYLRKETKMQTKLQQQIAAPPAPQAQNNASFTDTIADSGSFALRYLEENRSPPRPRQREKVFGPDVVATHSFGGRLHAHVVGLSILPSSSLPRSSQPQPTSSSLPPVDSSSFNDGRVQYPSLPSIPTLPSEAPPLPVHPAPINIPPPETPTPTGYMPSYRPRRPNDTLFQHGSAGINPLGAQARRVEKAGAKKQHPAVAALRRHRIVSGSFGSFEERQPSRFDERPYRLLQLQKDKGRKKEGI